MVPSHKPERSVKTPSLVFIYGPPAAGKLTVAEALAKHTGHRVFHNHASFDLVAEVLPPFSPPFRELVSRIRLDVIETSLRAGVDLIVTMVFDHPEDLPFMTQVEDAVSRAGARLCLVHLRPELTELERRVLESARRKYRKIQHRDDLHEALNRWETYTPVHESDLSIDNTLLSPTEVAELIQRHYNL
jgi:chloramphenicol 3-O-phosphotransferase